MLGIRTAILSNGELTMLANAVSVANLTPSMDLVYSIEAVRIIKPHRSVYEIAMDDLEFKPEQVAFQSANGADASIFGFTTSWINFANVTEECLLSGPSYINSSLNGLPTLLSIGRKRP